jgi:hypothetical protein
VEFFQAPTRLSGGVRFIVQKPEDRCICKRSRASARRAGVIAQPDEQRHKTAIKGTRFSHECCSGIWLCEWICRSLPRRGFVWWPSHVAAHVTGLRARALPSSPGVAGANQLRALACMEGAREVPKTDAHAAGADCETILGSRRAGDDRLMGDTGRMPLTKDVIKFGTFVVTSQVRSSSMRISQLVHLYNR